MPTFTPDEVFEALTTISNRKSTSHDFLIPILRNLADLISDALAFIFNRSLQTGTFPTDWKTATIIPIYKNKGGQGLPSNYRPISLLHPITRIFEKKIARNPGIGH